MYFESWYKIWLKNVETCLMLETLQYVWQNIVWTRYVLKLDRNLVQKKNIKLVILMHHLKNIQTHHAKNGILVFTIAGWSTTGLNFCF